MGKEPQERKTRRSRLIHLYCFTHQTFHLRLVIIQLHHQFPSTSSPLIKRTLLLNTISDSDLGPPSHFGSNHKLPLDRLQTSPPGQTDCFTHYGLVASCCAVASQLSRPLSVTFSFLHHLLLLKTLINRLGHTLVCYYSAALLQVPACTKDLTRPD